MKDERIVLQVDGMDCASCATTIEKRLSQMPGISSAIVNFATRTATVEYDPAKTGPSEIVKRIESAGYAARERTGELERVGRRRIARAWYLFALGLLLTIPILVIELLTDLPGKSYYLFALATPVQFIVGYPFYVRAYGALKSRTATVDSLVVLSTSAAYAYSVAATFFISGSTFYEASAAVITTVTVGMLMEDTACQRAGDAVKKLTELVPKTARVIREGRELDLSVQDILVGDVVVVRPGERLPADGVVIEGHSAVDQSAITGEPIPVEKSQGDPVIGGSVNRAGLLKFRAEKVGSDTALAQVIRLVEQAQGSKAPIQRIADRVVSYFVPAVVLVAVVAFCVWYLVFGKDFLFSLTVLVTVLVVSCPCALGIATPTALMVGIGKGAEHGMLIKSGKVLESAYRVDTVVFDKTGTVTNGAPQITDVIPLNGYGEREILKYASLVEKFSEHFLGKAVVDRAQAMHIEVPDPDSFSSVTGCGVRGMSDNTAIAFGNRRLMEMERIDISSAEPQLGTLEQQGKTVMILALNGQAAGVVGATDCLKPTSVDAVLQLKASGRQVVLLTGDNARTATTIGQQLGVDRVMAELLPADKVKAIEDLQREGRTVAMVGDGINDAPALAQADVGIAIGSGTDVALEAGDIVLIHSDPEDVVCCLQLSQKTMGKIWQNLGLAFLYNMIAIPIAAGVLYSLTHALVLSPMLAAVAMVLSDISVVGNSLLLRRYDLRKRHPVEETVEDPVCHMDVDTRRAAASADYAGKTYYFCAPGCKTTFLENPQKYVRPGK